ncbi:hypothetical protein Nepgr_026025 [Nepenthes gracilis]|uniref:Fumarylacetoacetase n=1 Tax=Nepenthes gracilis TaxID=150966 RepID=A0AAD3T8X8_NEPGR|nr:hypothetical protein Nepgr_026025 [Nepenthes gracilis]
MLRSSGKEQDGLDIFQMANLMSFEAIKICTLLQYAARIDFGPEKYLRSAGKFPFSSTIPCPWFASKISLGSFCNGFMRIVSMGSHCSSSRGSGPDDIELFGAVYVRRAVFTCGPRYMSKVEMLLPTNIGDYTDLFASLHHATNCGTIFHSTKQSSSKSVLPSHSVSWACIIVVSGTGIVRPRGHASPSFRSLRKLERIMATELVQKNWESIESKT